VKSRDYVQPQWIYDCINNLMLIPVKDYAPGKLLPPHLSPFNAASSTTTAAQSAAYIPEREKELKRLKGEIDQEADEEMEEDGENEEEGQEGEDEIGEREEYDYEKEQQKKKTKAQKDTAEQKELAVRMMTKKNRNILRFSNLKKEKQRQQAEKLQQKAKALKNKSK